MEIVELKRSKLKSSQDVLCSWMGGRSLSSLTSDSRTRASRVAGVDWWQQPSSGAKQQGSTGSAEFPAVPGAGDASEDVMIGKSWQETQTQISGSSTKPRDNWEVNSARHYESLKTKSKERLENRNRKPVPCPQRSAGVSVGGCSA